MFGPLPGQDRLVGALLIGYRDEVYEYAPLPLVIEKERDNVSLPSLLTQ